MDLEIIILSETNDTEKSKYHIAYMWNLKKYDKNELIYKTETDSQTQRTNLLLPGGRVGVRGGIDWEFGIDVSTLLYLKWITNKDLLYSTGNSAQYSVIT